MDASDKKAFDEAVVSSSTEDEDLEKFKEAIWTGDGTKKDEANYHPEPKPTRRLFVSDHQHDCNELQVTPEFRAHVAKKLEHMLDGIISEKPARVVSHETSSTLEDDLGFKLFATSIPGHRCDDTQCAVKRWPLPSSSESDSEMDMRIREAVVSVNDFLRAPSTATDVNTKVINNTTGQSQEEEMENPVPKNKKIKKISKKQKGQAEESPTHKSMKKRDQLKTTSAKFDSDRLTLQSREACGELEEDGQEEGSAQAKVKRKRRRKRKADKNTEVYCS